ncbi:MAG: ATP synthase F0 subunit C [Rubrobacter sp.]|jgi:F-type H+-transporting ATPase subunit c|nr:ATP synthase F0 subunit C [Rubrobacter sp.]MDQ3302857.1 ATP synthase F0 subunit C [Actinomycetota bacterium]
MDMMILAQVPFEGLQAVGFGVAAGTAVIGSGIGMGYLFGQTIASIHRQPEAFELSRTWLFVGIGLIEAQALFGLAFALLIGLGIIPPAPA